MASSQTSRISSPPWRLFPLCLCGEIAPVRTSNVPRSKGRRFFGCANFRRGVKCSFFEWIDPPITCDCGKEELSQSINRLERELERSKAEGRRRRGVMWATWTFIICVGVVYLGRSGNG